LTPICTKSFVGWGLQRSPDSLAVFRGPGERREGKGRTEEVERRRGEEFVLCPRKEIEKSAPMSRSTTI